MAPSGQTLTLFAPLTPCLLRPAEVLTILKLEAKFIAKSKKGVWLRHEGDWTHEWSIQADRQGVQVTRNLTPGVVRCVKCRFSMQVLGLPQRE